MRAGSVRAERKSASIAASLLLSKGRNRRFEVLDHGSRQQSNVPRFLFMVHATGAQVPSWNAGMRQRFSMKRSPASGTRWRAQHIDDARHAPRSICLTESRPPRYLEKTFEVVATRDDRRFPGLLKILLVPQVTVAALVHTPIKLPRGFGVPLSFVSFYAAVLQWGEQCVLDHLSSCVTDDSLYRDPTAALSTQEPSAGCDLLATIGDRNVPLARQRRKCRNRFLTLRLSRRSELNPPRFCRRLVFLSQSPPLSSSLLRRPISGSF